MNTQSASPLGEGWAAQGRQPKIAVIGAGVSGLIMTVTLDQAGYTDITVFEKADRVGGTWRENTYPGLSCDVPAAWYRMRCNPRTDWAYRFAYGPEIQRYVEQTADMMGITPRIRFNTGIKALTYQAGQWRLETQTGEVHRYDIVIAACGLLHHPKLPDIEGLESFEGALFHTARWDHSVDYKGKRVGLIGTGSTAAQIVGAITKDVGHLSLFQRTPQWMLPLAQKKYSALWRWCQRRVPGATALPYYLYYKLFEHILVGSTIGNKTRERLVGWIAKRHLRKSVADPALREKLTPDYTPLCKRMILCSDFYPAISSPNAELVTDGIERIEQNGVRTRDGRLHALDILVCATGFDSKAFLLPMDVTGANGENLADLWGGAPRAHRGVSMPGFPNFWMLEGPTSPVGNLSLIFISEYQARYITAMIDKMKQDRLAAIEPTRDAFEKTNAEMAQAVTRTVWFTGGCDSWYLDATGKPNLYPFPTKRFRREMSHPDFSEFHLIRASEPAHA